MNGFLLVVALFAASRTSLAMDTIRGTSQPINGKEHEVNHNQDDEQEGGRKLGRTKRYVNRNNRPSRSSGSSSSSSSSSSKGSKSGKSSSKGSKSKSSKSKSSKSKTSKSSKSGTKGSKSSKSSLARRRSRRRRRREPICGAGCGDKDFAYIYLEGSYFFGEFNDNSTDVVPIETVGLLNETKPGSTIRVFEDDLRGKAKYFDHNDAHPYQVDIDGVVTGSCTVLGTFPGESTQVISELCLAHCTICVTYNGVCCDKSDYGQSEWRKLGKENDKCTGFGGFATITGDLLFDVELDANGLVPIEEGGLVSVDGLGTLTGTSGELGPAVNGGLGFVEYNAFDRRDGDTFKIGLKVPFNDHASCKLQDQFEALLLPPPGSPNPPRPPIPTTRPTSQQVTTTESIVTTTTTTTTRGEIGESSTTTPQETGTTTTLTDPPTNTESTTPMTEETDPPMTKETTDIDTSATTPEERPTTDGPPSTENSSTSEVESSTTDFSCQPEDCQEEGCIDCIIDELGSGCTCADIVEPTESSEPPETTTSTPEETTVPSTTDPFVCPAQQCLYDFVVNDSTTSGLLFEDIVELPRLFSVYNLTIEAAFQYSGDADISFYPPGVVPPDGVDNPVPPAGAFYEFMFDAKATINVDGVIDTSNFTMGEVEGNGFGLDNIGTYVLSENGGGFVYKHSPADNDYKAERFADVPDGGFDPGNWTFQIADLGPGDQITIGTGSIYYCGECGDNGESTQQS